MENSPEEATAAAAVAGAGDLRQTELPRVRRRLVQSTLFPHKSPEIATERENGGCDRENDHEEDEEEEEEEYCGSQGRKKRKQKPRASKKVAVNGKGILSRREDDKDSPPTVKSNVFLQASQGQHPQKEQQCIVSPEANDKSGSPLESAANMKTPRQLKRRVNSTPKKKQTQTTPKKYIKNGYLKDTCPERISDNQLQGGNATQPIPDLWLEAKMKAEEDARIFGSRQIHPFFSSTKTTKNIKETTDMERNWCSLGGKDESTTFSPIHVFEKVKDDAGSLDWKNWIISERSFISSNCDLKTVCSPVSEGSVNSLHFDDFLILYPSRTSLLHSESIQQEEVSVDQSPVQQEHRHAILATLLADEPPVHYELLKDVKMDWQDQGHAGHLRNSDPDWDECRFLHERTRTYYHSCGNHPVNSLWTNKYLPQKAIEVCGNGEAVNFLSEWLRLWYERGLRSRKDHTVGKRIIMQDDDYNCYHSDCDSENRDEDNSLKNVLLVTGPVGSGKSAAIYACAKEQGFHVIEVSASDWRTRTLVMQKFEGGIESHCVQSTLKTPVGSESKRIPKSFPVIPNTTVVQGSESEVIELIPLSDEEDDSQNATGTPTKFVSGEIRTATDQTGSKTLILFEDVDAILSEDHGLIATIQKLAETAKRPIILTTNNHDPVLPNNLDRLELCFTKPSLKELLCHVNMVCAAEKAKIQPYLVERFIGCCQGDIRKTIMHLQFWCQGQRSRKDCPDGKEQRKYGPLLFDLDTGHRILPKIIPWGYPSQLSEIVEKEITNSLLMTEESSNLMEVVVEGYIDEDAMQSRCKRHKSETEGIAAKKEAMLRRHCPVQDGNEFETQFPAACEFSNSSGSPVAFTRRNCRRKLDTVLSSDSGSENLNDRFPGVEHKLFEDTSSEMFLEVHSKSPSCCLATGMCFGPLPEQHSNSEVEKLEESFSPSERLLNANGEKLQENGSHCLESALCTQINGTMDVSCVPESSYVPETEVNGGTSLFCGTVSSRRDAHKVEVVSSFNDLVRNLQPFGTNVHNRYVSGLHSNPEMQEAVSGHDADIVEAVSTVYDSIQNMQPIETNNHNQYVSGLHSNPEMVEIFDVYMESARGEEVGDSHNEHVDAVPRGYPVMDECSRMDFSKGTNSKDEPSFGVLMHSVQETWRRIRGCQTDLRQYVTLEEKEASKVLTLAYGMSNLVSEADMLLGDCHPLLCDSLEPSMVPNEKSHSFSWYDDQLWMTSTIAQHGICYYSKEIASAGSNNSSVNRMDLASEMLASSTNTMALGKLVSQDMRTESSETGPLKSVSSVRSESDSRLSSVVQSIVPSRSYLSTKGDASFYEYLSSLGQMSRSEASRLSESIDNTKQRRGRVARNYLSTGALMLSPDDISLLGQCNCYGKVPSQSLDTSLR